MAAPEPFGDVADDEAPPPDDVALDEDALDDEPVESPSGAAASRLFRVFTALLDVHLVTARAELRRDQARIARGLLLLLVGTTLLVTVALLAQVVGVSLLMQRGYSLLVAVLVVAGADVVLGTVLIAVGARSLRRPVLPSTRALIRRTVSSLRR